MKLEIIKEQKFNEPAWYFFKVDDVSYQCSRDLQEIKEVYENVKNNPDILKNEKTILISEEI
jgi:hypothetical protein